MNGNGSKTATKTARSTWGRTRFGSRSVPALALAIPVGVILAVLASGAALLAGFSQQQPLLGAAVAAGATVAPLTGLAWAVLVDRNTLRGAAARPEESVESRWYGASAAGAFHDLLIVVGLATAVLFLTPLEMDGSTALVCMLIAGALSVGVRYAVNKRRG
ncbi:hypothetical protein [Arthrobacter sp. 9AX]|uniref:hypothetical protein n=1 Tax=Arthrobacter sp. 9AX TaxID=2653131 RepID=UPI001358F9F2|nr:hypothetical protein [Arthrobacter sp. 9AX]